MMKIKYALIMIGMSSFVAAYLFFAVPDKGLHCEAVQVGNGYGYLVLDGKDTLIYQPYIPAVGRRMTFGTKEEALKIGKLVCSKLQEGQSPTIGREEIVRSGVMWRDR